ncbi:MAG TPA: serine protease [Steroidobacteraceae bacterium]|jgi:hypothetical protein|nr:serine protease [Steroidobacteraceae bacterium]
MQAHRWVHWVAGVLAAVLLPMWPVVPAHAAALDGSVQQHIRTATFEVVQLKPPDGAVQYERPLPLDLIPYQQRTDKYRSIGTAFAIGANRYVTAAHVMMAGNGSQFGAPALRDAAGNVYAIDKVLKYADREDFVVFSLRDQPKGVQPLEIGVRPAINDTVFAVGNALGEGIVIRDGVYTSDTPEELNGEWKWLRFSAAASPGNSGGPLVDQQGKVVGVVLRKTEAENLNYALSMDQIRAAPDGQGRIENRSPIRLSIMDAAGTMEVHEQFKLPLSLPEFYHDVVTIAANEIAQGRAHLIAQYSARLFPHSSGSAQLLHQTFNSPFPRFIHENQDGVWMMAGAQPQVFQLGNNGFLRIRGGMIRLRAPDDVKLASLYGDSKLLMDLILKGYPLQRQVGSESVRVTSLGKAQEQGNYTDSYGRVWQVRSWAVPYADLLLSALCLPTPEGYDVMLVPVQTGFQAIALTQQEFLTDYLYVTMTGTLAQWRDYLGQKGVQPRIFTAFKLDIDPDQHVRYRSKRFSLDVTPDLIKLSKDSMLTLDFDFYRDAGAVVWDVGGAVVRESDQKSNWIAVGRIAEPEPSLPQGFQSTWSKIEEREYPFNSMVFTTNGTSRIRTVADAASGTGAGPKIQYILTVVDEGDQSQAQMSQQLALLQHSFKPLEH